jgi:hypothetical protein
MNPSPFFPIVNQGTTPLFVNGTAIAYRSMGCFENRAGLGCAAFYEASGE